MAVRRTPAAALARARSDWSGGRYEEALKHYGKALVEAPLDVPLLIEAARAYGLRRRGERCLALLDKALRLGGRRYEVHEAAGETYRLLDRPAQAEACFRRACQLAQAPATRLALAELCERRHALDEAEQLVAQVLHQNRHDVRAQLLAARIERRRGRGEEAAARLRRVTAQGSAPPSLLAAAWGELAEIFDEAGDVDVAWSAILRCKQLLQPGAATAAEASQFVLARCRRMLAELRAEHFRRWAAQPLDDPPRRVALLTGFPRTGTTLLEQVLAAHPDVVGSEEKELFSAEVFPWLNNGGPPDAPIAAMLDGLSCERIAAGRRMYLDGLEAMLGEPIGARLHVDKNPGMTMMIPALRRLFPELRLLVALRDPRDVILSCFLRYLPLNGVTVNFLSIDETARRYALDLEAWLRFREMIDGYAEIRYERLVADLPGEARQALATLGAPWDDRVLEFQQRAPKRPVRSPTYVDVTRPVYATSIGRWRRYARHMGSALEILAPLAASLGYND